MLRQIETETFKILNGDRPNYMEHLIDRHETKYAFRYTNTLVVPNVKTTNYGLRSFRYSCAKIWNTLPEHTRVAKCYKSFKTLLATWDGITCRCTACKH